MGFLDRIKSLVATQGAAPAASATGPLALAPGDAVGWYQERWAVVGVRRLQAQGDVTWQYCLRDRSGQSAVLAAEEGGDQRLWLQRPVQADVSWDKDVLDEIDDEPFKLSARGQATVTQTGATPVPAARTVSFREFEDPSADRTVVLEDWMGKREIRVGESVHEAELTFVRAADGEDACEEFWGKSESSASDSQRGTPLAAAARALTGISEEEFIGSEEVREDQDPTAFDDEEWAEQDERADTSTSAPCVEAVLDSEEDEWIAAAEQLRHGAGPADSQR